MSSTPFEQTSTFQLIKELTELQGVSGNERQVRQFMKEQMEQYVDELDISPLGNIFGVKKANDSQAPKLMMAAHMDEVGFMVKRITKEGQFSVIPLGGWNPYVVSAQRYTLQTKKGDYVCVSSSIPPHLLRGRGAQNAQVSDILFDAGFSSKEQAEEYGVRVGDTIVPETKTVLTANKENVIAKAWDNRYGCVLVLELLKELQNEQLPNTLIAGASVQEEVGLRGIKGAVHTYEPDVFIALDCSPANDLEGAKDRQGVLGDGFLLRIQDPGMITHPRLLEFFETVAEEEGVKYQPFFSKGGTDAGAAHTMNEGIPSAVIGVPGRYIHGHQTLFNISDYEQAKHMALAVARQLDKTTLNTLQGH